jgi:hypothetical protein
MPIRWGTTAASVLACAALAAGCGGSGAPGSTPVQGPDLGVPLRLADCRDWKKGDVSQRLGTVRELRDFAGGPVGQAPGHGNVLDDKKAYELLQNYCGNFFARGFKLYKLYERAAAFTPPS